MTYEEVFYLVNFGATENYYIIDHNKKVLCPLCRCDIEELSHWATGKTSPTIVDWIESKVFPEDTFGIDWEVVEVSDLVDPVVFHHMEKEDLPF